MDAKEEVFESAARYFSVLSEPARLKILHSICGDEKSVNAIMAATGMAQANASRHLGLMYQAGMLSRRREGTQVFYRVSDSLYVELCRTVSTQIELRMGLDAARQMFVGSPSSGSGCIHLEPVPHSIPSIHKEKASV